MRSFSLTEFLTAPINLIGEKEFVYFTLPPKSVTTNKNLVSQALKILSAKTSRLFLSLKSCSDLPQVLSLLETLGETLGNKESLPKMIGVPLELGDYQHFERGSEIQFNDSHLEVIKNFRQWHHSLAQNVQLVPEFTFLNEVVQVGPTLLALDEEFHLPFYFLSVQGEPELKKIDQIKSLFSYLQMRGFKKKIYLSFDNPHLQEWNIKTFNTFSGMKMLHIDLSNKCTHSCIFCGVWGPQTIDLVKNENQGTIPSDSVEFMNRQMPTKLALGILEQLPETVDEVQFGGVGDPLTHPEWPSIIKAYRQRGIRVEVLTNLEYPTKDELNEMHEFSKPKYSMHLYVNISAGNRATYTIIRPRQSVEIFDRVIGHIEHLHALKKRDGFGIGITMLHVINKNNYRDMVEMVELAHRYESRVWLKPLEIHAEIHRLYEIPESEKELFKDTLEAAIAKARELDVELIHDSLNYFKGETQ